MMKRTIGRGLAGLEDGLHVAGCLCLGAVALLINADIILRLVADTPVEIQFELTELYLMPAVAALSLARVWRDGGHLALDIFPEAVMGRARGPIRLLVLALSALFCAAVTWKSGEFAARAFLRGEIEYGAIDWPLGWAYATAPLGFGALTLRLLYDAVAAPTAAPAGADTPEGAPEPASAPRAAKAPAKGHASAGHAESAAG